MFTCRRAPPGSRVSLASLSPPVPLQPHTKAERHTLLPFATKETTRGVQSPGGFHGVTWPPFWLKVPHPTPPRLVLHNRFLG